MFKTLLFDRRFRFDVDGNYWFCGKIHKPQPHEIIVVKVANRDACFKAKWLALAAHYEIDLPIDGLLKVMFTPCDAKLLKLRCGHLMEFTEPIEEAGGARIVPGFTMYTITPEGVVKSRISGTEPKRGVGPYGYPIVNIYDPDKNNFRQVLVHLLLARAFVVNDSPGKKYVVNHKDGDKLNLSLDNLEWVTPTENNNHAIRSGFRTDNAACEMHDVLTGEVLWFQSVSTALHHIGYEKRTLEVNQLINGEVVPRLFKNRYELRLVADKRDWYHQDILPSERLTLKRRGIIEVKNLKTGVVTECMSFEDAGRVAAVSRARVRNVLFRPGNFSVNNHLFRIKCDEPWPVKHTPVRDQIVVPVKLVNRLTGETHRFPSVWKAARFLQIDKQTLRYRLTMKKGFENFDIEEDRTDSPNDQ